MRCSSFSMRGGVAVVADVEDGLDVLAQAADVAVQVEGDEAEDPRHQQGEGDDPQA